MPSSHSDLVAPGKMWPPPEEAVRLSRQRVYRDMFNLSEPSLLVRSLEWKSRPVETYTSAFVKMVSFSYANLLAGEPMSFTIGEGKAAKSQAAIKRIMRESRFGVVAFNAAIGQSVEGRTYLKVRRGKLHSRDTKERVVIENLWSQSVFRLQDPGGIHPLGFVISTQLEIGESCYLKIEVHYPGEIVHELWSVQKSGVIGERQNFEAILGYIPGGIQDPMGGSQDTGVDELLVTEIDNLDTNGWSLPDMHGSEINVRLLEDRLSRDTEILNKHASPKLAVPPGVLDEKGQVQRTTFDGMVFEMGESGLMVPTYITWDPKVKESMEYFDKIIGLMLANTGLTHQIVGLESKLGWADSGTALRLRMIPTLAKVNAKKLHLSPAFDAVVRNALALADGFGDFGSTEISDDVDIAMTWRDGIPADPIEESTVTRNRTAGARTMSTKSAVRFHNPDMSEDSVKAEMADIKADEAVPAPGEQSRQTRVVDVDLNAA